MSLLDGDIAALFGEVFGSLYLPATLHRSGAQPAYNSAGHIYRYEGGDDVAVRAQIDAASWAMRQSEGFVDGDVKIIVLAADVPAITTDYQLTVDGKRWMIRSVDRDPAKSHWICRGRAA